jgi:hypothetical protein
MSLNNFFDKFTNHSSIIDPYFPEKIKSKEEETLINKIVNTL